MKYLVLVLHVFVFAISAQILIRQENHGIKSHQLVSGAKNDISHTSKKPEKENLKVQDKLVVLKKKKRDGDDDEYNDVSLGDDRNDDNSPEDAKKNDKEKDKLAKIEVTISKPAMRVFNLVLRELHNAAPLENASVFDGTDDDANEESEEYSNDGIHRDEGVNVSASKDNKISSRSDKKIPVATDGANKTISDATKPLVELTLDELHNAAPQKISNGNYDSASADDKRVPQGTNGGDNKNILEGTNGGGQNISEAAKFLVDEVLEELHNAAPLKGPKTTIGKLSIGFEDTAGNKSKFSSRASEENKKILEETDDKDKPVLEDNNILEVAKLLIDQVLEELHDAAPLEKGTDR